MRLIIFLALAAASLIQQSCGRGGARIAALVVERKVVSMSVEKAIVPFVEKSLAREASVIPFGSSSFYPATGETLLAAQKEIAGGNLRKIEWKKPAGDQVHPMLRPLQIGETAITSAYPENRIKLMQRRFERFVADYIVNDPQTGKRRSTNWDIRMNEGTIYIKELKLLTNRQYKQEKTFRDLVEDLEAAGELSLCIDLDPEDGVSISVNLSLSSGPYSFSIKYEPAGHLEVSTDVSAQLSNSSQPVDVKVTRVQSLYPSPQEDRVSKINTGICYPFRHSQMELSTGYGSIIISPKSLLLEF